MTEATTTLDAIAREASEWFETSTRASVNGGRDGTGQLEGEDFTRLRDGAPQWVTDLTYAAHGDFLPDDWRYDAIRSALDAIGEVWDGSPDVAEAAGSWADGYVDVYTAKRLAWLASNLNRAGYIAEAVDEGIAGTTQDVAELAGIGQYMEAREVFESVVSSLTAEAEAREAVA